MIYIVTGKTGHGKTAYCIKWVRNALLRGEVVYSNTKINPREMFSKKKYEKLFGNTDIEGFLSHKFDRENEKKRILYWQNFADWALMHKGLILCDEGIVYFNARNWEALPKTMQMKFVQHRKENLNLLINVQHYSFIDKTLRMLCERFINVELKLGSAQFKKSIVPRISMVTDIDLPTLNRCENLGIDPYNATEEEEKKYNIKNISKEWFWIRSKVFTWYDSSAKMMESKAEPLIHIDRECPKCGMIKTSHS